MNSPLRRKILLKSWCQPLSLRKSCEKKNPDFNVNNKISLGNFRLVNNLGKLNSKDTTSKNNHKWVSDSSDYIRFRSLYPLQKEIKPNSLSCA